MVIIIYRGPLWRQRLLPFDTIQTFRNIIKERWRKTHRVVGLKTVAHKLARASYYVIRDETEFQMKKAFG